MALVHQSFNQPMEIEIRAAGRWHDLTHVNAQVTAPFKVQSLSWKGDEFNVQGWLILPEAASRGAKCPLVTIVHGGPASAFQPAFLGAGQARLLLDNGYALLLPTLRAVMAKGELCNGQRA